MAFNEIKLTWQGKPYVIPPRRVLEAVATVEEKLTFGELQEYLERGAPPVAKVTMAWGALLRYAGADVEDDDVFVAMFSNDGRNIVESVKALLMVMLPPAALVQGVDASGNGLAVGMGSSNRSTRPQSKTNGSRPRNSGNSRRRNAGGSSKHIDHHRTMGG